MKNIPSSPLSEGARCILEAAEQLFAEHGFDGVTMHAIAERSGVSKANIFHHFGSKEGLYMAVIRTACHKAEPLLQELVQNSGSLSERLAHFTEAHLAHLLEHQGTVRLMLRELLEGDSCREQMLAEQAVGENFSRFIQILSEGRERGELRGDIDPAAAATLLVGANVFFFQARELLRHIPAIRFAEDPRQYSQKLIDILLYGLMAPPDKSSG